MVKVAAPASAWLGMPVKKRVEPSSKSHAGPPEMLYVKLVFSGAKVDDESWKLYGRPTRATVGTCELKGKATSGVPVAACISGQDA